MAHAVKAVECSNPAKVSLVGPYAVMQHPNPVTDQALQRGERDASAAMVCLPRIFRVAKTRRSGRKLAGTRRGSRMAGAFITPKRSATGLLGTLLNVRGLVSNGFTDVIWEWDARSDRREIRALFSLCEKLQFLAMPAADQAESVPDCPCCKLIQCFDSAYSEFQQTIATYAAPTTLDALSEVSLAIDSLTDNEAQCFNREIFHLDGWTRIRDSSSMALIAIEWGTLDGFRPYLEMKA
ncbi:hypothetical protein [Chitinolyticbacter albus]|uniref:hypothetical protein n=1 Tax=Chitinolyticbacter albus TaxID=2961951 RepID=UPI00210B7C46|nr:hypothetical protein [Chitinolyticbacter albus]